MGNSSFFHGARFKTAESALAQSYGSTPNQKRSPFTVPHPQLCNPAHLLPLWQSSLPLTGWTSVCCLVSNEILLWHQKSGKVQVPFIPSQYPLQWPVMVSTTGLFRMTNWFSHLWKWHFPCLMSGRPNQTKAHMSVVHHVTPRRKARRAGTKATFGALKTSELFIENKLRRS